LLAEGKVSERVTQLPQYDVSHINDSRLLNALFRDYTFLATAYLLEECHLRYLETGNYGLARE